MDLAVKEPSSDSKTHKKLALQTKTPDIIAAIVNN